MAGMGYATALEIAGDDETDVVVAPRRRPRGVVATSNHQPPSLLVPRRPDRAIREVAVCAGCVVLFYFTNLYYLVDAGGMESRRPARRIAGAGPQRNMA